MKLTDFFSSSFNRITESKGQTDAGKMDGSATERLNRQIKALTPGKTLQGEVIGKNGNEVQIRLSDDLVMTARLEQDVNVEEGRVLTFEVKNNGASLSLSPLFANTAASDNVLKALQMAGLPVNQKSVAMTELMMQQGMSVDSKSLQSVFRDLVNHAGANVSDVVALHRMQMPVQDANLQQMESYRQLTHELVRGMTDVLAELPAAFSEVLAENGTQAAVKMYQSVLQALSTSEEGTSLTPETVKQTAESILFGDVAADEAVEGGAAKDGILSGDAAGEAAEGGAAKDGIAGNLSDGITAENIAAGKGNETFAKLLTMLSEHSELNGLAEGLTKGTITVKEAFVALSNLPLTGENGLMESLKTLFENKDFHGQLEKFIWKNWALEPEQGIDEKKVQELYQRLKGQLDGIREALMEAGSTQSGAMKSTVTLSQNLDFMNQINQMYTYVQLPLKMQNGNTNGELYVYTNKQSLAKKDGSVSAFLHLDMEHLGPVDVYVAMQNNKVSTRFSVRDEEMLLFLNDHMQLLTDRLNKKGYDLKCEMSVKDQNEEKTPIDRILQTEKNNSVLMQYGFDVRA